MKNKFFSFVICSISLLCNGQELENISSAITWQANGGRFGDNLVSYARTKWLSYKHNIPFICRLFPYSDLLMLHEQETLHTSALRQSFSNVIHLPLSADYHIDNNSNNTLYICHWKTKMDIDWSDIVFIKELKKNIAPRQELEKVTIPDNCISIAVHIRTGGNYAKDETVKERYPLRFVPDKFLIAQIKRLTKIFDQKNIYVHIFTDHPKPINLVEKFKRILNNERITFGYREQGNSHDFNVVEDLFAMMTFDCLVRPQSNFSRFAQILGKNKVAIYPESVRKNADGTSEINVITIQTRNNENEAWITEHVIIS